MSYLWKLVIVPALLAIVKSESPLDFEEPIFRNDFDPTIYRIPTNLDPIHYTVEITPYFEAEGEHEAFTFDGIVTLTVKALEDNISVLTLQENVREITDLTLTDEFGTQIFVNETHAVRRQREYHFLRINLRDGVTLVNGENYILTIKYIGNINEYPLSRGIFRGYYTGSDGRTHWYAASHLQPVNSRQAFPSFDEPGFKSYFDIIINRPTHFAESYSNMRIRESIPMGNRTKEVFRTTPRMSAYLVSVHISEEFTDIADNNNEEESYRILARPNAVGQGEYALEIGPPITQWLVDYFNISYYAMGDAMKNDQIAVPDWASGATENWGLVSYRELRLLYQEGETSAQDKMSIGTITAHELAHKWFGNLITCKWWDNVWINEGFASYFEYFAMDGVDKSMELEDQFNIMYVQSALSADSAENTRALQHTVNSPAEVTGHFSGISYSKGASLLLMLKHYLTEDTFKMALNRFLVEKSYEHAVPDDLYSAFASAVQETGTGNPDVDITDFMRYWVDEPGYPLLQVDVDMGTGVISLSQERFFISPTATPTDQVWPLPLTYTTGNNPDWENLSVTHVMTEETDEITKAPGHEWVIFNVQQKGIYRVNYDIHNWEMLAAALNDTPSSIHHLNRAQIVDDVFALMRAEKMTYNLGFKMLDFLKKDTSYYVWYPAISGFNWIRNRLLHTDVIEEFDEILRTFLDAVIEEVGYDVEEGEPLTTTLNRFHVLSFACNIGHVHCINDAVNKYFTLQSLGTSVNPNIRRHVFCKGLHEGSYSEYEYLYQRRLNSNNQADSVAMLRAMGCTTNERALQEYFNMVLDDNIVKAQDRVNALSFLYMGDRSNANVFLQFLKERREDIKRAVVLDSWYNNVISNLASYLNEAGLQDMEQWLQENQDLPEYSVGTNAIRSTRTTMQWGTDRAREILRAARGSAIIVLPTLMLLITTLLALFMS